MSGKLVTVFGGSGFLGRYVVRALCKNGYRIRVATRRPHLAGDVKVSGTPGQVQLVQCNVRNRASVARALDGADAAVNLVGILFQMGKQKFNAVQANGAKIIAEEAAAGGVDRLVHLSAIGADALSQSVYARSKAAGEDNVLTAFPDATVLRPSVVFGPEDQFFNRFAEMFAKLPALVPMPLLFGGGKTKFQPIYAGDVADAIVSALDGGDALGATYELGGPTVYTFKQVLELILQQIDRQRLLVYMPWAGAYGMGHAGQAMGMIPFIDPFLTPDQVTLMRRDNVVADDGSVGTLADLGVAATTAESIIPSYLYKYRTAGQFHEKQRV